LIPAPTRMSAAERRPSVDVVVQASFSFTWFSGRGSRPRSRVSTAGLEDDLVRHGAAGHLRTGCPGQSGHSGLLARPTFPDPVHQARGRASGESLDFASPRRRAQCADCRTVRVEAIRGSGIWAASSSARVASALSGKCSRHWRKATMSR
jgi:hypothetical protein